MKKKLTSYIHISLIALLSIDCIGGISAATTLTYWSIGCRTILNDTNCMTGPHAFRIINNENASISIKYNCSKPNLRFEVLNILGSKVASGNLPSGQNTFNVPYTYKKGVYILLISSENESVYIGKFCI